MDTEHFEIYLRNTNKLLFGLTCCVPYQPNSRSCCIPVIVHTQAACSENAMFGIEWIWVTQECINIFKKNFPIAPAFCLRNTLLLVIDWKLSGVCYDLIILGFFSLKAQSVRLFCDLKSSGANFCHIIDEIVKNHIPFFTALQVSSFLFVTKMTLKTINTWNADVKKFQIEPRIKIINVPCYVLLYLKAKNTCMHSFSFFFNIGGWHMGQISSFPPIFFPTHHHDHVQV